MDGYEKMKINVDGVDKWMNPTSQPEVFDTIMIRHVFTAGRIPSASWPGDAWSLGAEHKVRRKRTAGD